MFRYTNWDDQQLRAALAADDALPAIEPPDFGCTGHLLMGLTTMSPDAASDDPVFLTCDELSHLAPEVLARLKAHPPLTACGRLNLGEPR